MQQNLCRRWYCYLYSSLTFEIVPGKPSFHPVAPRVPFSTLGRLKINIQTVLRAVKFQSWNDCLGLMRKLLAGCLKEKEKLVKTWPLFWCVLFFWYKCKQLSGPLFIYKFNCLFVVIWKSKYEEESVSLYMWHYLISASGLQSLLLKVGIYLHIRIIKRRHF